MQLTNEVILQLAKAHHDHTGDWPLILSGSVQGVPGETWARIDAALRSGSRGLAGNSSLAMLLADHFGIQDRRGRRPGQNDSLLSIEIILEWAYNYRNRAGKWPVIQAGQIEDAPGETWARIDYLLRVGGRGLPGKSSLPQLLAERLGVKEHRGRKRNDHE